MLSIGVISRLLGRDILIYPFRVENLKGIGYNLSVGPHAWSLRHRLPLEKTPDGNAFRVEAGDTALIYTAETVWVSRRVGGTFHSKVDRVSEGFSSISTTLDPEWIGPLLIAITNLQSKEIDLRIGDTLSTLVFHRIDKAGVQGMLNPPGRTDRLLRLGITPSQEVTDWLKQEFRHNDHKLRALFLESDAYKEVRQKFRRVNLGQRARPWVAPALVFAGLLFLLPSAAPQQQLAPVIAALGVAIGVALTARR